MNSVGQAAVDHREMSTSINLGLERIRDLLAHLPTYTRPTCHIAGTNGKGSVTALLSSILKTSSYRVGRFNSPHLISVLDSITIDDVPFSQLKYSEIRECVEQVDKKHKIGASSFEILTATALSLFEDAKVDVAVVEVGMGGRLDATNVITDECILVSALTAVDLDHQAFLGDTVEEIAAEKVAIARKDRPFVFGPQVHKDVEAIVTKIVLQVEGHPMPATPVWKRTWDPDIDGDKPRLTSLSAAHFQDVPQPVVTASLFPGALPLLLPLRGDHQLANLGIALTIVSTLRHTYSATFSHLQFHDRITPETVAEGVKATRWPGRLSFHKISLPLSSETADSQAQLPSSLPNAGEFLVLADGAHNRASSATLSAFINDLLSQTMQPESDGPRTITLTYLLALSHSPPKTPQQTLIPLFAPLEAILTSAQLLPNMTLRVRIALLRFTPPEGMPWVRSEPPSALKDVVSSLIPAADTWTGADEETGHTDDLSKALDWAADDQRMTGGGVGEGLIIVAGSLYLVADFYRLLQGQAKSNLDS